MQGKKIYLAVPITNHSVGDLGALSSVLYAREILLQQRYMVKVQCVPYWDVLLDDTAKYRPDVVCVVEGMEGKVGLEVYHQVLPDWDRYRVSYHMASEVIYHTTRLRKMHNRYVQAGYMMQWMQEIAAPAIYVRLGVDAINLDDMYAQGRAIGFGILTEHPVTRT